MVARLATNITVGIACCEGTFAAFVVDADTPACLRKEVLEAPGGQSDSSGDVLSLMKRARYFLGGKPDGALYLDGGHCWGRGIGIGIGRVSQIFAFLPRMALCGEKSKLIEWRLAFASYRMWDGMFWPPSGLFGMQSRHPGGCKGWLPPGSQKDYNDTACELGTCVGTATHESFSGLGLGHRAFVELCG